jgi:hypothetical protein
MSFIVPLLSTLSWIGFISAGFVLWSYGNTNGGYSMVGIAICLPAVVAAALPFVPPFKRNSPAAELPPSLLYLIAWLGTLSWAGFLVCGFILWYVGNTNGGYSMVGIAICLPAAVAAVLSLRFACTRKAVPALPTTAVNVSTTAATAPTQ